MSPDDVSIDYLMHVVRSLGAKAERSFHARLPEMRDFLSQLSSYAERMSLYENLELQQKALKCIPLDKLRAKAAEDVSIAQEMGDTRPQSTDPRYRLLVHLTAWFKREFFAWTDTMPCFSCGNPHTKHAGMVPPSPDDLRYGASRVEAHQCPRCGTVVPFPRYNHPGKLLETRRGRCGEWANCFALMVRSCGFEVRFVLDTTDHVWVEVYMDSLGRWIHVDPCENALDAPLLYEQGWGKKLQFVFAMHRCGMRDVTPRYTRQLQAVCREHRGEKGAWTAALDAALARASRRLSAPLTASDRATWALRDAFELAEFLSLASAQLQGRSGNGSAGKVKEEGGGPGVLPGRTTGSLEWRQARGECGTGVIADASSSPGEGAACRPPDGTEGGGTSWRRAPDASESLASSPAPAPGLRRLTGGFCRASGENAGAGEVAACAFDGRSDTKWLDFGGGGPKGRAWLEYALPVSHGGVRLREVRLVSANDEPSRDPRDIRILGTNDPPSAAASRWVELARAEGLDFPARHHPIVVQIGGDGSGEIDQPFRRFRLVIDATRDPATASCTQLQAWELFYY